MWVLPSESTTPMAVLKVVPTGSSAFRFMVISMLVVGLGALICPVLICKGTRVVFEPTTPLMAGNPRTLAPVLLTRKPLASNSKVPARV